MRGRDAWVGEIHEESQGGGIDHADHHPFHSGVREQHGKVAPQPPARGKPEVEDGHAQAGACKRATASQAIAQHAAQKGAQRAHDSPECRQRCHLLFGKTELIAKEGVGEWKGETVGQVHNEREARREQDNPA